MAAALLAAACGRGADGPDPGEVVPAFDRMAAEPLWPGFQPEEFPLAWFDGRHSYLVRHPSPPEEFSRLRGVTDGWRMEGRHPAFRASTVIDLEGVPTATVWVGPDESPDPETLAAVLIHEAFHAFQDARHPAWTADEMAFFDYPILAVRPLQLRRLEIGALRRALDARDPARRACWARGYLSIRGQRFRLLPPAAADYEQRTELREGLARYVERRAARDTAAPALPYEGFAPGEVRRRGYAVGQATAYLLDRMEAPEGRRGPGPGWKDRLESGEAASLDGALSTALAGRQGRGCRLPSDEVRRARTVARSDSARAEAERAARLSAFLEEPGWRVVVRAAPEAPLWPRAFDPMNLEIVGGGRVIHERWLQVGGDLGELEVMERAALTAGLGDHPLFEGVGEVVVTGLREQPEAVAIGDSVWLEGQGLRGSFARARLERDARVLTILVGS